MLDKFPDVLQFCGHVSRLMVSEIRRRASNQSTGEIHLLPAAAAVWLSNDDDDDDHDDDDDGCDGNDILNGKDGTV